MLNKKRAKILTTALTKNFHVVLCWKFEIEDKKETSWSIKSKRGLSSHLIFLRCCHIIRRSQEIDV